MNIYLQAIITLVSIGGSLSAILLLVNHFFGRYGSCKLKINDQEPIELEGGCKLLEALYDRKIFIPSACGGQGACGFCKTRVLSGGGPLLPTEEPYLTEEEKKSGVRLACQVKIRNDIEIQIKQEYLNVRQFTATIGKTVMLTEDIREIHLILPAGESLLFQPGQYIQVIVPHAKERVFRAYSIASTPGNGQDIELLVRKVPNGLGSSYLHSVQEGDAVSFTGPYGDFILDPAEQRKLICIGGGVGMAPMRSLLRHIAENYPTKPCWLFFGARTSEQAIYAEDFISLAAKHPNLHIIYALSEPEKSPEWKGVTGFIHESVASQMEAIPDSDAQAFLCGPPKMLEAARKVLLAKGLKNENIFADEF